MKISTLVDRRRAKTGKKGYTPMKISTLVDLEKERHAIVRAIRL